MTRSMLVRTIDISWYFIMLFILFCLLGSCTGRPAGRIAGIEPLDNVYLFENHSESYLVWKEHDVNGRILVHIDGHIDCDWIPEGHLKKILSCRTAEDVREYIVHPYRMNSGYGGSISIWNFIYPAACSGMVREFFWVVPGGTFDRKEPLQDLRSSLAIKMHGITPEEIGSLEMHDGLVTGRLLDIPITICELGSLPVLDETVLLDIDVDYLSTDSAIDQKVVLDPAFLPDAFIDQLSRKQIRSDIVTISSSSIGGFLPPAYHYFGDVIKERLSDPHSQKSEEAIKAIGLDDPVFQDADLHEADALRGAGKILEAISLYRKYLSEHTSSSFLPYAQRRLATALADSGQSELALNELKSYVARYPDDADARYYLARLYKEEGRLKEATDGFRAAIDLDPFNGIYATELGSCLLSLGEETKALAWLQKALELKPCNGNAHLNLAFYYYRKKDLDRAVEEFKGALLVRPWDSNARFMLGRIYFEQKKYMAAREEWQKVIERVPDHPGARRGLASLGI